MPSGNSDYVLRFFSEVYGKQNLADLGTSIQNAATQARVAKEATEQWGKTLEAVARGNNISVKELTNQLKLNAEEQRKAAESAAQYGKLQDRMRQESIRLAEREVEVMRRAATESRRAAEEATRAARANLELWLGGAGSAGGGGGGVGGRAEGALLGRIGGRVAGAEVGRLAGIPGGGFIGSQVAQGLGVSGQTAVGLGLGAVGLYAGFEAAKYINETTKWAQEVRNLGREFGVTAGAMATFTQASEVLGINAQGAIRSVSNLSSELEKGGTKYKEVVSALSGLGLSPETAFKPTTDAINDIVVALTKIPNEGERSRKAVDLLGESGRNLAALVKEMPDLNDKLRVSDDAIDRVARMRDVLAEIDVKGGMVEALSYLFQGILPDRNGPRPKLALPAGVGAKPLDTGYGLQLNLGTLGSFGEFQSTAAIKAGRLDYAQKYAASHGTPEDKYQATLSTIDIDRRKVEREFREDFTLDEGGYNTAIAGVNARKAAALALKKKEEEDARKQEEYTKLIAQPIRSNKEGNDLLLRLNKDFPGFRIPPSLYGSAVAYAASEAGKAGESEFQKTPSVYGLIEGAAKESRNRLLRVEEATPGQREADRIQNDIVNLQLHGVRSSESQSAASISQQIAITSGQSRYNLTPAQVSRLELSQGLGAISAQVGPQIAALRGRAGIATEAAGASGISDEQRFKYQEEAHDALIDAENKETEARTKAIESVNKFNDSVDKAAEAMRSEFAGGFESILMGAQSGAQHGQPGKGVLDALRGFGEKTEGAILHNVGARIFGDPSAGTGISGGIQKVTRGLPDWLTQGTILGHLDKKQDPGATLITSNADKNASRIVSAIQGRGGGTGGTGGGGATGGGSVFGGGDVTNPDDTTNVGAVDVANRVSGIANSTSALSAAVRSGSPSAIIATLASSFGKIGKSLGQGIGQAGDITAITDNYEGETRTEQAGAIIGSAALGIAAAEGIRTMARGGARNVLGGLAATAGAVGAFTGPAAPFVEAGAAVAGLAASFIPDPKTARANQISKAIFTQQYLAPPAENISESGSGGYADFDINGGVRNSRFSPYPITTDSYLDVPRRTVVPGGTLSTFGGTGGPLAGTGAQRPQVPNYTLIVSALDSKSINDNAHRIADAVHLALRQGHEPLIHEVGQQLGLR